METTLTQELFYLYSAPIVAIAVGTELAVNYAEGHHYHDKKDTIASVLLGLTSVVVELFTKVIAFFVLGFFFFHRWYSPDTSTWGYWIALLLLQDFGYWLCHYAEHKVRILWASHLPHHSSEQFNITVGFRASVFKGFYRYLFFIPIAFLGYHPAHILLVYVAGQIHGIFVHTRSIGKLGFLEWIFVTPSHHRVHHASNLEYLDKNYGQLLIIWDRLFGTFQEEKERSHLRFGIDKSSLDSKNPLAVTLFEWKNIRQDILRRDIKWLDRLRYIVYVPGWSHDGTRKTTKMLQSQPPKQA